MEGITFMGFKLKVEKFDEYLEDLRREYKVYAPVKLEGKGLLLIQILLGMKK